MLQKKKQQTNRNYMFSIEHYNQDAQGRHSFPSAPNWGKSFKALFKKHNFYNKGGS